MPQVEFLWRADYVDDPCRLELADAEAGGRDVAGMVERPAITALQEEGRQSLTGIDDDGAVLVGRRCAAGERIADDVGEHRLVEALAVDMIERHAEPVVAGLVDPQCQVDDLLPDFPRSLVAVLQPERPLPRGGVRVRVLADEGTLAGVEVFERRQQFFTVTGWEALAVDCRQRHAEALAPVADVVVADDPVAECRQDVDECLANDRRADVADVHALGDVRR